MSTFNRLVNEITAPHVALNEMALAVQSLDKWKEGILSRLTTRKGVPAGVRMQQQANYGDQYHHNVYYFNIFTELLKSKLLPIFISLYKQKVITDKESYLKHIHEIVSKSELGKSKISTKLMQCIANGLESNTPLMTVSKEWFLPLVIELIVDNLFKFLFNPNTENIPVTDIYGKPSGVFDFYSPIQSESILIEAITDALDDKGNVLQTVADTLNIPFIRNSNQLKLTAKLLAQTREGSIADFETTHPTER